MRLREALGRDVVARDTAETVGRLHGAVVDAASRRIVAVQVGKGRGARVADWSSLAGVGADAVVLDTEASLRHAADDREQRSVKGDIALLGGRVLTDRGDVLGTLDDLEFDEGTGDLVALFTGDQELSAARLRSIGAYAVVVADEAGG